MTERLSDSMDDPSPAALRRALVIVNAASRSGGEADAALRELREAGLALTILQAGETSSTDELILSHRNKGDLVVLCGGDGTLHHAARAIVETGLPMGVIPLGTGNDLARSLGLPLDPVAAARVIAAGATRRIDLGEVNGRLFFNVASVGLSAELARRLDPAAKRRWGRFGYMLASARVLLTARPFKARILHDGQELRARTYQISVGNGRYYGGGNAVHHEAEIDDGKLHLYSLEAKTIWRLVLMAPFFRAGRHVLLDDVRALESQTFTVTTRRPRSVNADGELVTKTPAVFRLRHACVTVFAP